MFPGTFLVAFGTEKERPKEVRHKIIENAFSETPFPNAEKEREERSLHKALGPCSNPKDPTVLKTQRHRKLTMRSKLAIAQ